MSLRRLMLAGAILIVLIGPQAIAAEAVSGPVASIHDGDTLTVRGHKIRLWGIDAPELNQRCLDWSGTPYACGHVAREALVAAIAGRPVRCLTKAIDRYHRTVATCLVGSVDLAAVLVAAGRAVDYPSFSHGRYRQEQQLAHNDGRGLWGGWFDLPWVYRGSNRQSR